MGGSGVRSAVRRARQAVAVLGDAGLRDAVVGAPGVDERKRAAVGAFDWVGPDGPDTALLATTGADLRQLLEPEAVLAFDRIARLPAGDDERHALSKRIVTTVADRLGASRPVSEAVLNAAVAMFTEDVAAVRRDAVDLGLLERTPDGASYRFAAAL